MSASIVISSRDAVAYLKDKDVLVMGAAPLVNPVLFGDRALVAVNGGIHSCPPSVDVWVLNGRTRDKSSPNQIKWTALMESQGAKHDVALVALLSKDHEAVPNVLRRLAIQRTIVGALCDIPQPDRLAIETRAGGRTAHLTKHALSAGMFAVAWAFDSGAASVELAGFSWKPGYSYTTALPSTSRGHEYGDKVALAQMQDRYGTRLHHYLELPKGRSFMPANTRPRTADTPRVADAPAQPGAETRTRVVATRTCWYNNQRQRPDSVFTLRKPSHFKPNAMRWATPADEPRDERMIQMQREQRIVRTGGRRLAPNMADVVGEPVARTAPAASPIDDDDPRDTE